MNNYFSIKRLKTFSKPKFTTGFTLVEMLVAIAVFMIVVMSAVGALYSIIDANRKAQAIKNVINNVNFALDSISREMRMGKDYKCIDSSGGDVTCGTGGYTGVSYISHKDLDGNSSTEDRVWYKFVPIVSRSDEGNIQRGYGVPKKWESLTAPEYTVKIKNMTFYVRSTRQPFVFITIEGESGIKEKIKTDFSLQTTVSQRSTSI